MTPPNKQSFAFSLVELSIVLVILGLLTGGILAGQSLIRAAELRSVSTDFSRYKTAAMAFRDKYFAIPGDFTNATSIWGSLGGTGSNTACQILSASSTATCNGDGNGSMWGLSVSSFETGRLWQHLANAGLIEGQYTGLDVSGNNALAIPGTNVPTSKMQNSYFAVLTGYGTTMSNLGIASTGSTSMFAANYGMNMMVFTNTGGSLGTPGSYPLTPAEAWNIDTKNDDGNPATGIVMAIKGNGGSGTNCTTFAGVAPPGDAGAAYSLSTSSKDCYLFFPRVF